VIDIQELTIRASAGGQLVLDSFDLKVGAGERVAVIGESGSGKTTLALAMLGQVRAGLRFSAGRIEVAGQEVLALAPRELQRFRREAVCYLPQDPASALTPSMRVRRQLTELADGTAGIAEQLVGVGLPGDEAFQRRYPHELSGGQRQRLAVARALSSRPRVLILDEPTTGLDAIVQRVLLDTVDDAVTAHELSLVFITHDLNAARRMADRLVVLRSGRTVDDGPAQTLFDHPVAGYTRELTESVPRLAEAADRMDDIAVQALLEVRGLSAGHGSGRSARAVVRDVSLGVGRGECVAIVGGSGSGKTTLLRCLTGLHRPADGSVLVDGAELPARLSRRTVAQRAAVQLVSQDPAGTLNPRRTVAAAIDRPLRTLRQLSAEQAATERDRLLQAVGLDPAVAARRPRQLSGGQQQRAAIARALAAGPRVLLCDEITASLDVRVQAAIIELLRELMVSENLAILMVTHDLGVVARLADRVMILADGEIREQGPAGRVLLQPQHDWTKTLLEAALPQPRAARATRDATTGRSRPIAGNRFSME